MPNVKTHEAWGLGSYIFTNVNPSLHSANGFEVPNRPGIAMHDLLTVSLNKAGTIDHVINGVGAPVTPDFQGRASSSATPDAPRRPTRRPRSLLAAGAFGILQRHFRYSHTSPSPSRST
jgi:hypothetical protein